MNIKPHHQPEAEMSLLGGLILEPAQLDAVRGIIPGPEVFYTEVNAGIYELIERYDSKTGHIDLPTLVDGARRLPAFRDNPDGAVKYLEELAGSTPGAVGCPHWARLVAEAWRQRRMLAACQEAIHGVSRDPESLAPELDKLETALMGLHDSDRTEEPAVLEEAMQHELDRLHKGGPRENFCPTNLCDNLDPMLNGGVGNGDLIIVACRPSMGKSAALFCLAASMASPTHPVGIMSMEMGRQSVCQRLMAIETGVPLASIITGKRVPGRKWIDTITTTAGLRSNHICVDDCPSLTPMQLRARARVLVRKFGIKSLFVDYLQLMHTGGRAESRQVEVSEISRQLKALARELRIPVFCAAQLNRAVEGRADNRPRMSDLRESGSIEQDADIIILLHREEYYHVNDPAWFNDPENADKVGKAEWIVCKHRNGATGVVEFSWDAECARFGPPKPYVREQAPAPKPVQQEIYAHSIPE